MCKNQEQNETMRKKSSSVNARDKIFFYFVLDACSYENQAKE